MSVFSTIAIAVLLIGSGIGLVILGGMMLLEKPANTGTATTSHGTNGASISGGYAATHVVRYKITGEKS